MERKQIVITAPSGAGKTTIAKRLLAADPRLSFSVSATTRNKRQEEKEGKDYYFMSVDEFRKHIEQNDFVEWEEVYHETFYGTLQVEVEKLWQQDKAILFDVDVQGAIRLKRKYPDSTLTIFIRPPQYETLVNRLHSRATEPPEKIEERIKKAAEELKLESSFDVTVTNDNLEQAISEALLAVQHFLSNGK